jgi:IPT/TIG domain
MKKLLLLFVLFVALALPACSGGGANNCPFNGLIPNGRYQVFLFNATTGEATTLGVRTASPTGTMTVSTTVSCSLVELIQLTDSNLALSASPSSIDLASPPATVTITGQGFDATYGMPRVEYFDTATGYWVGTSDATSVWSGGTALQCNVPNLSAVYSGAYTVRVTNKTSQGFYTHIVGTATVTAYGRDRADSDGDGWYDDQDCDPWNPFRNIDCSGGNCSSDPQPVFCPVQ